MAIQVVVHDRSQLEQLEDTIREAAARSCSSLAEALSNGPGLPFLRHIKFHPVGCDPLRPDRPLNLIEQVNQSFTYVVSVRAAEFLFDAHAEHAPFVINFGARPGFDIESHDGHVAAEVFAATKPESNNKLRNDVERVRKSGAACRYVFYYVESERREYSFPDVRLVKVELESRTASGA